MKKFGLLLLAGILPLLLVFLFMKFVSLNISYAIMLGTISLFLSSLIQRKVKTNVVLKMALIALPLCLAYYLLVVTELSGLWVALPLFLLAVLLGFSYTDKRVRILSVVGVLLAINLLSFVWVPQIVADNLGQSIHSPAPNFELNNLSENNILNNSSISGKVVLLDFFGTWCAPCIAEMSELKKVKEQLAAYENDLMFVIACIDKGRDTPESARKFHADRQLPFLLAFDEGSVVHQDFGFTGVPGLVILDKKGNMRFKHEGFNQAENLPQLLVPILEELLEE